ncbi:MAG TPA: 3-dehydroquinate synthase [Gemmatimonadaceae bacterium]|nr:3-dehydroquinate synthase [Gemmatimonadaceae bacterium]
MSVTTDRDAFSITIDGYQAHVGNALLERAGEIIRAVAPAHRYAIISDENVAPLYAPRLRASLGSAESQLFTIPPGESHKTREQWAHLTDALLLAGFGRDTTVLALGGGVIGDLAGFVAATYMRGIPFVQLPTTLLAMIDASIGGKTGVDTAAGKNLVGAFHQPRAVIADASVLATLPVSHLRSGLAEAIKHGAIADAHYYGTIDGMLPSILDRRGNEMQELIARSIEIKATIVRQDEREGGIRRNLNFGHTLGHAIESESGYSLLHGEAIAIGMVLEAQVGESLGVTAPGTVARLRDTLQKAGLPIAIPKSLDAHRILAATRNDKKAREGVVEYALVAEIGRAIAGVRAPDATVMQVLTQDANRQEHTAS